MSRSWPDPQAQELFVHICQVAAERMNTGTDISAWEAHTLGRITGICHRYPGVPDAWRAAEDQVSKFGQSDPT